MILTNKIDTGDDPNLISLLGQLKAIPTSMVQTKNNTIACFSEQCQFDLKSLCNIFTASICNQALSRNDVTTPNKPFQKKRLRSGLCTPVVRTYVCLIFWGLYISSIFLGIETFIFHDFGVRGCHDQCFLKQTKHLHHPAGSSSYDPTFFPLESSGMLWGIS